MFERFTDRARRVVVLSQEEARLLSHDYIGTEHLLLGLIHEHDGVAGRALSEAGVTLEAAKAAVVEHVGRGVAAPEGHMPFTEDAKEALERSLREALQLVHNYIGTEHILLSLIAADDGPGLEVLRSLGVAPVDLRDSLLAMMSMAEPSREFPLDRFSTRGRSEARTYARSESPFEARYGFSRGVRQHDRIEIAGTAPIPPDGAEVAATAYDQMLRCGEIALEALESLGGGVADVIRTVMYITDPSEADEIGRAHAELFGEAAPAATMVVVASLLDPEWKVEIEVSAQL